MFNHASKTSLMAKIAILFYPDIITFLRISCEVEIKQQRANHISHTPGSQEPWCGNA